MNTDLIRSVAKALICALISTAVLLFISAGAAYAAPDPDKISGIFAIAILLLSALVGGMVSARISAERPMITSLLFAGVYTLLHISAHLVFDGGQASFLNMLISYAGMFAAAVLGCVITNPKSTKASKGVRKFKKYTKRIRG